MSLDLHLGVIGVEDELERTKSRGRKSSEDFCDNSSKARGGKVLSQGSSNGN